MNIFEFILRILTFPVMMQIISVLILSGVLSFFIKTRKQRLKDYHDISELRRDLRALTTAALGVGERVLKVERQQKVWGFRNTSTGTKISKLPSNNESSYEHAIHMVQKGADVNDLVNACGLSQGEADLVNLLHRINDGAEKKFNGNEK